MQLQILHERECLWREEHHKLQTSLHDKDLALELLTAHVAAIERSMKKRCSFNITQALSSMARVIMKMRAQQYADSLASWRYKSTLHNRSRRSLTRLRLVAQSRAVSVNLHFTITLIAGSLSSIVRQFYDKYTWGRRKKLLPDGADGSALIR